MTAKVDQSTIQHIAKLANLKLSADEENAFEGQISRILDYVAQLNSLSDNSPISISAARASIKEREDRENPSLSPDIALAQAPKKVGSAFQVPRIIDIH